MPTPSTSIPTHQKTSVFKTILIASLIPWLLMAAIVITAVSVNGLITSYEVKKSQMQQLARLLATSADSPSGPSLVARQVSDALSRDPLISTIVFYSVDNPIDFDTTQYNDWRTALLRNTTSFHQSVTSSVYAIDESVGIADESDTQGNNQNVQNENQTLVGYINVTLNVKKFREEWFAQNLPSLLGILAAFAAFGLWNYLIARRPLKILQALAVQTQKLMTDDTCKPSGLLKKRLQYQELDVLRQWIASSQREHAKLVSDNLALANRTLANNHEQREELQNSSFQSMIIHELKSSLNEIFSGLQLIEGQYIAPEQEDALAIIHKGSNELDFTLNQIVQFHRIEKGQIGLNLDQLDPVHLINQVINVFSPIANEKGLKLTSHIYHVDHILEGDADKIKKVLEILLQNALKFTEQGEVTVSSRLDYFSHSIRWTIDIADTGVGIENRYLEDIFLPFFQVPPASGRSVEGVGIGLGVAYKLTKIMEGELTVQSEVGVGSVFKLVLPLRDWQRIDHSQTLQGVSIVYHSQQDADGLRLRLSGFGAQIVYFADAEILTEHLKTHHHDAVIFGEDIAYRQVMSIISIIRAQETNHRIIAIWHHQALPEERKLTLESIGLDYILDTTLSLRVQAQQLKKWVGN